MYYIYALIDPTSEKIRYVGVTNDLKRRISEHLQRKDNVTYKGRWLLSLRSLNLEPRVIILEYPSDETWQERERYWISFYREKGEPLTNLTDGGDGTPGFVASEETRRKRSEVNKGRIVSPKTRAKISQSLKGHIPWNKGQSASEETRRKIGLASKGRVYSPEARMHMSQARMGHPTSTETRKKIGDANRGTIHSPEFRKMISDRSRGKVMSEESRRRMSEARKGHPTPEETRIKISNAKKGKPNGREGTHQSQETIRKRIETRLRNRNAKNNSSQ